MLNFNIANHPPNQMPLCLQAEENTILPTV